MPSDARSHATNRWTLGAIEIAHRFRLNAEAMRAIEGVANRVEGETGALVTDVVQSVSRSGFSRTLKAETALVTVEDVMKALEARPVTPIRDFRKLPVMVIRQGMARHYQWSCVHIAYKKSGFIVAPCGAGKTLIGLMLASVNGGRVLILTNRYATQWRTTIEQFFHLLGNVRLLMYGAEEPDLWAPPDIVIATYGAFSVRPKKLGSRLVHQLPYETLIVDEAHGAAAPSNIRLIDRIHAVHKYALTATKVREDGELEKLEARIGPTLVCLDRTILMQLGFVAAVTCLNLVVEYDTSIEDIVGRTMALAIHPNKVQVLCSCLQRLCEQGHKTLVFCDDLFCLNWTYRIVKQSGLPVVAAISMNTPNREREAYINRFSCTQGAAVLFLSRTGDEALDVPSASAGLVFWNHWASRRQIVQRIGRIARVGDGPTAVFIVLLANDAKELENSVHREAYLEDHGFSIATIAQHESEYGVALRPGVRSYIERLQSEWHMRA